MDYFYKVTFFLRHQKSNVFETENKAVVFDKKDLKNLNIISSEYNKLEKPKLLNPENKEDQKLFNHFEFDKNGSISSKNERCDYTITELNLNEERTLKKWRYQILKNFRENIEESFRKSNFDKISFYIEVFVKNSNRVPSEYIAFRKYAVNNIIGNIVNEITN